MNKQLNLSLALIDRFFNSLAWAKEHGLEHEYMRSFLQDFAETKSITSAVDFAECEWDDECECDL